MGFVNVVPPSEENTSCTLGLSSASVYHAMATRLSLAAADAALTGQALISHLSGYRIFDADHFPLSKRSTAISRMSFGVWSRYATSSPLAVFTTEVGQQEHVSLSSSSSLISFPSAPTTVRISETGPSSPFSAWSQNSEASFGPLAAIETSPCCTGLWSWCAIRGLVHLMPSAELET